MAGDRPFSKDNPLHRDPALSATLVRIGGDFYVGMIGVLPSTPTMRSKIANAISMITAARNSSTILSFF